MKFLISGGGTGGHIYPAIAIANELKERFPSAEFLFVGAKDKMEMQKIPQAGYQIKGLWISGIQRKITIKNLLFPVKLLFSLCKSYGIIRKFNPDIAIGTGGFASGAVLKMAQIMQLPTLIQEQNSYPGITNKLLAKKATAICVAYHGLERFFPKEKIQLTGNPVRQDIMQLEQKKTQAQKHFKIDTNKTTLLILGGSLGAKRINQLIAKKSNFITSLNVQIIWQCGKLYYDEYQSFNNNENISVYPFINKMDYAYAVADCIISRSGASSISELCMVAKPTILIPSPNVSEDHQTKNAQSLVKDKAAIMITEKELEANFNTVFSELITNKEQQKELQKNIKQRALPNATKEIVNTIEQIITK